MCQRHNFFLCAVDIIGKLPVIVRFIHEQKTFTVSAPFFCQQPVQQKRGGEGNSHAQPQAVHGNGCTEIHANQREHQHQERLQERPIISFFNINIIVAVHQRAAQEYRKGQETAHRFRDLLCHGGFFNAEQARQEILKKYAQDGHRKADCNGSEHADFHGLFNAVQIFFRMVLADHGLQTVNHSGIDGDDQFQQVHPYRYDDDGRFAEAGQDKCG